VSLFIARSHPERDEEPVREPEPLEPCHCGEHGEGVRCPAAEWDLQVERALGLIAALRERGISLRLSGDRVQIVGGQVEGDTLEKLKSIKPVLLSILSDETSETR
jgi:hypothetical protein